MSTTHGVLLEFHPLHNTLKKGKALCEGLSAVVQVGLTLWVTNDETLSLERLTLVDPAHPGTASAARHHQPFALQDYVPLPVPPHPEAPDVHEADVEGLAYADGYLWLVGSHSLKRRQPRRHDGPEQALQRLAQVRCDGNRYLLARIPLVARNGTYHLAAAVTQQGQTRTAARVSGDDTGNALTEAVREDAHLGAFLALPGKDNGFDIEGLAVVGPRLFLGLRGPVLRGWAVLLEVALQEAHPPSATLQLQPMGPHGRPYRKHILDLGGLGIRDLCVHGADLLILAGPTMELDGPVTVFRWPGGAQPPGEQVVSAHALERVLEVPYGQGEDHAEGMTLFTPDGGTARALLVVYDAASPRRQVGDRAIIADVFPLARPA